MEIYEVAPVSYIYEYNIGWFPLKSMGLPLHYEKLRKEDIPPNLYLIIKDVRFPWLVRSSALRR
jgi:hypothetical protein